MCETLRPRRSSSLKRWGSAASCPWTNSPQRTPRALISAILKLGLQPSHRLRGVHPGRTDPARLRAQDLSSQKPPSAHMAPGKLTDPQAQLLLLDRRDRNGQALGGAVLAHQTSSTAGTPGIVPAELRQLCGGVPGSEVTLGQLLLLRRSQGLGACRA